MTRAPARSIAATSSTPTTSTSCPSSPRAHGLIHSIAGRMGNCRHRHRRVRRRSSAEPRPRPLHQLRSGRSGRRIHQPSQRQRQSALPRRSRTQWFDTSAVLGCRFRRGSADPTRASATPARTPIVGPGRVNFTTSLYKSFAMTERAHFELRFESFNTFNHFE